MGLLGDKGCRGGCDRANTSSIICSAVGRHLCLISYPTGFRGTESWLIVHPYAYNIHMRVEWDPHKAAINLKKHGIRFSDAESVLFDPNALAFEDATAQGEQGLW